MKFNNNKNIWRNPTQCAEARSEGILTNFWGHVVEIRRFAQKREFNNIARYFLLSQFKQSHLNDSYIRTQIKTAASRLFRKFVPEPQTERASFNVIRREANFYLIKKYKPITSSIRHKVNIQRNVDNYIKISLKHTAPILADEKPWSAQCPKRADNYNKLCIKWEIKNFITQLFNDKDISRTRLFDVQAHLPPLRGGGDLLVASQHIDYGYKHPLRARGVGRFATTNRQITRTPGRNNQGRITMRFKNKGHKKSISNLYKICDLTSYNKLIGYYSPLQLVTDIKYSPYHSAYLATLTSINFKENLKKDAQSERDCKNQEMSFGLQTQIIAPEGLKIGQICFKYSSENAPYGNMYRPPLGGRITSSLNTVGLSSIRKEGSVDVSRPQTYNSEESKELITEPPRNEFAFLNDYYNYPYIFNNTFLKIYSLFFLNTYQDKEIPREAITEGVEKRLAPTKGFNVNSNTSEVDAERARKLNLNHQYFNWIINGDKNVYITNEIWKKEKFTPIGSTLTLKNIPIGTNIYNVELKENKGGKIARAAGCSCLLLKHFKHAERIRNSRSAASFSDNEIENKGKSLIRLPSKKLILVSWNCKASLGLVSNSLHFNKVLGKAGASRWLGIRPRVKGEAMNPVDHPHGGKTHRSGGLGKPFKTKWGKLAKWQKLVLR